MSRRYLYNSQPEGAPVTNLERQDEEVEVQNLRALPSNKVMKLKENGLQLCELRVPEGIDWSNEQEVQYTLLSWGTCQVGFYYFIILSWSGHSEFH